MSATDGIASAEALEMPPHPSLLLGRIFDSPQSELERRGGLVNASYAGIDLADRESVDTAWRSITPFNRLSSMASALYLPVEAAWRRHGTDMESIARLEHRRWNAFHEAMGFRPMSRETLRTRFAAARRGGEAFWNRDGRAVAVDADDAEQCARYARFDGPDCMGCGWRHLCLVSWDRIDEVGDWYAALSPEVRPRDFKQDDRNVVALLDRFGDDWLDRILRDDDGHGTVIERLLSITPETAMRGFVERYRGDGTITPSEQQDQQGRTSV